MIKELEILLKYAATLGEVIAARMYEDGNIFIDIKDKDGNKLNLNLTKEGK